MDRYPIGQVTDLVAFFSSFSTALSHAPPGRYQLRHDQLTLIRTKAHRFKELLEACGLAVTASSAQSLIEALNEAPVENQIHIYAGQHRDSLRSTLTMIANVAGKELETKLFLPISAEQSQVYYPPLPHFGSEVRAKYTQCVFDIDEGAKCLALGHATASVFHMMRVVERALRAMNSCLALKTPDSSYWDLWLKPLREEGLRRGDQNWLENPFFQDVFSRFDAIREARRDRIMHVESIYTDPEARLIFESTEALMKRMASRMNQDGLPRA